MSSKFLNPRKCNSHPLRGLHALPSHGCYILPFRNLDKIDGQPSKKEEGKKKRDRVHVSVNLNLNNNINNNDTLRLEFYGASKATACENRSRLFTRERARRKRVRSRISRGSKGPRSRRCLRRKLCRGSRFLLLRSV